VDHYLDLMLRRLGHSAERVAPAAEPRISMAGEQ
jgi:hypothetical protein